MKNEWKNKSSIKYTFFIVNVYLLIFQNFLQGFIPIFRYYDEMLALSALPICFVNLLKNGKIRKINITLVTCGLLIIFVGLYSNLVYKIQPLNIAFSDVLLTSKFFLVYFLAENIFDTIFVQKNRKPIYRHVQLIIYIFLIMSIINYLFQIWPYQYRFGIMSNTLFYDHPTYLAGASIFLLALILLVSDSKKIISKEIIICVFLLVSTMRFKAIGAATLAVIVGIIVFNTKKKISVNKLAICTGIVVVFVWDQISYYYIDMEGSARNILTSKAFEIAKDFFPIGAGFGTYGSHVSSINYSPLYYKYNLSGVWGLAKGASFFVSDTFWPMILGQFGLVGLCMYIYMLSVIFKKIQKNFFIGNITVYLAKIICLIYLVISSTAESAFVNPLAIPLALIIGVNDYNVNRDNIVGRRI